MTFDTYNPRTQEGLDLHALAMWTAKVTGRVIFGQLWVREPSMDDVLAALYVPAITSYLNRPSPLKRLLMEADRT